MALYVLPREIASTTLSMSNRRWDHFVASLLPSSRFLIFADTTHQIEMKLDFVRSSQRLKIWLIIFYPIRGRRPGAEGPETWATPGRVKCPTSHGTISLLDKLSLEMNFWTQTYVLQLDHNNLTLEGLHIHISKQI